ncbi:chitotriosidase-1-like [Belonocnema kinseyi]|uniref:chitotriosidase-1-like n=1 Tax=Belonocnema kinseyi TaxID=2817044 RepID=UPI00143CC8FC|nr:chitotriosidase-1-like [Belonocnema kinseyi]
MYSFIFFLAICSAFALNINGSRPAVENEKMVGCYYQHYDNKPIEEMPNLPLNLKNVDKPLCTHLYHNWAGLDKNTTVVVLNPEQDTSHKGFEKFNKLRKKHPTLKTLISMLPMWNVLPSQGYEDYSKLLSDPSLRDKLVDNVFDFVKKYKFNGIELYWNFPDKDGKHSSDKKNFVSLLKEFRAKFDKESLILSVQIGSKETIADIYDINGVSKYVHFINLQTFDSHNSTDTNKKVYHNAALFPSSKESAQEKKLNLASVVEYCLKNGAPAEKLILEIPFYGTNYTLADRHKIGRGAPISAGNSSARPYNEICLLENNPKWKHLYDDEQKVPYIYKKKQIIAYDNVQSIKEKAKYAMGKNLGGAVIWTVDEDDFEGKCGGEKFPLLKALNRALGRKF